MTLFPHPAGSNGNIKILASSSTKIPSGSAHITFDQKYTSLYVSYMRKVKRAAINTYKQ